MLVEVFRDERRGYGWISLDDAAQGCEAHARYVLGQVYEQPSLEQVIRVANAMRGIIRDPRS